jgi:HAD superfamily hydrolase (TIGR01549 family)
MRIPDFSAYEWIFLDLDGTLWNHEAAAAEALDAVAAQHDLPAPELPPLFHRANTRMWEEMKRALPHFPTLRKSRWLEILEQLDRADLLTHVDQISRDHVFHYLAHPHPLPGMEVVLPLLARHARLAIATNGFHETQDVKVAHLGHLAQYFEFIFCPDDCKTLKSSPDFYRALATKVGSPDPSRCLMVGDSLSEDVVVPLSLGWDTLWLRGTSPLPPPEASFHVASLEELEIFLTRNPRNP